jgi:hypothetical protein
MKKRNSDFKGTPVILPDPLSTPIFDTVFTLDAVSAIVCVIVKKKCTCRML